MREVIKVAYYRAVLHVDHSDNLVIVIRYLKKAPQDFIQGKQEVDTFVGASRIAIEELRLQLVRWGLQLLKVQLIHRSQEHLIRRSQEHLIRHYSMESLVVEGSNQHLEPKSVDCKLVF